MKISATIIAILFSQLLSAQIYVSQKAGSQNSNGTEAKPFNSINSALSAAKAGETIIVNDGIFRETVNITKSNISIVATGNVSVTGTDIITNFTQTDNNIYKAFCPKKVTQLFIDGTPQVRAKYPNQKVDANRFNFTTIKVQFEGNSIISDEIPKTDGFFDGATVWMIVGKRWVGGTAKVKKHTGNKLLLSNISSEYYGEGIAFISDIKNCLDNDGEWYWNNDTLYFYNNSINLNNCKIEAKTRETLINLQDVENVKIEGINGYAGNIIFKKTEGCKISNGEFIWLNDYDFIDAETVYFRDKKASSSMYGVGVAMFGNKDTLSRCEVSWAAGDCVSLYGTKNVITDCKIHDANYRGTDAAPVAFGGSENQILYCEIYNGGRDVISAPSANKFKVFHNIIHNSGLVAWDVGLLYTYSTDGRNAEIAYNIVFNAHSDNPEKSWGASGIYLDNNSRNFLVHHNVSYNAKGLGIQINDPGRNIRVYNNTVFNTHYDMAPYNNGHFPGIEGADCKFYNNYIDRPIKPTNWIEERGNFYSNKDLLQDRGNKNYLPKPGSELIDKGVVVEELKEIPFNGKAPDIGAYELGMPVWKAGPRNNK